ncbi:hypothetical protein [Nocardia sp. alder85J]|uniref:hypothetical protein n=1 Tax=Nocardia sp. alder85J TaxID=2862949 RepID=UPI001CD44850|nr:hypothetical protein [Nocardia sp. alder85J]MCX4095345.1 hypothetical protein [Nocardia sp. alder85J]
MNTLQPHRRGDQTDTDHTPSAEHDAAVRARIAAAMQEQGLGIKAVATEAGLDPVQFGNTLLGKRDLRVAEAFAAGHGVLHIPLDELFAGPDETYIRCRDCGDLIARVPSVLNVPVSCIDCQAVTR